MRINHSMGRLGNIGEKMAKNSPLFAIGGSTLRAALGETPVQTFCSQDVKNPLRGQMRKRMARRFPEENGDAENNDVSVRGRGNEVFRRCAGDVEVLRLRARAMGR